MSKRDSNIVKGIAILMMYLHHLFYSSSYTKYPINWGILGQDAITVTAGFCKACVACFVFVSAYGLTKQYKKKEIFAKKIVVQDALIRYFKLLLHFWCVYGVVLVISCILQKHTFWEVFGENGPLLAARDFFLDLMGLSKLFRTPSFNSTWWYLSFATLLFVVLPVIYKLYDWMGAFCIPLAVVLANVIETDAGFLSNYFLRYLLGIALAVVLARTDALEKWKKRSGEKKGLYGVLALLILLLEVLLIWVKEQDLLRTNILDNLAVLGIVLFVTIVFQWKWTKPLGKVLESLGVHSMNMFLIHTFVKTYFFQEFTYSFQYWLLIFVVLAADTWLVSVVLEFLKRRCGVYKLQEKITKRGDNL